MSYVFQDLNIVSNPALLRATPFHKAFPRNRLIVWITYWMDAHLGFNAKLWRRTSRRLHLLISAMIGMVSPLAGLLFVTHPLTTMGWDYVAGRSGLLSGLFQLTAAGCVVYGHTGLALFIALIAIRWLKEDSVMLIPMILVLRILC